MFGLTSLIVSAVLLGGLFGLRYAEIGRGARFMPHARYSLDTFAIRVVTLVIYGVPRFVIRLSKYVLINITDLFSSILLKVVRYVEEKLHILVHRVRGKKDDLLNETPVSNHLTDMKNHKEAVSKTIEELEEVQ